MTPIKILCFLVKKTIMMNFESGMLSTFTNGLFTILVLLLCMDV